jgi:type I restriction enzyme, R subunit
VNRPFEGEGRPKIAGFVLDFVGIFEKLEKALAFDSSDVAGVVSDIGVLFDRFGRLMERGRSEYLPLAVGKSGDKAAEAVLEHFRDEEARETFYAYFQELEELYEILSPDARLREAIDDFGRLAAIHRLLRASYEPDIDLARDFLRKTERLVREKTEAGEVIDPDEVYILDERALTASPKVRSPTPSRCSTS